MYKINDSRLINHYPLLDKYRNVAIEGAIRGNNTKLAINIFEKYSERRFEFRSNYRSKYLDITKRKDNVELFDFLLKYFRVKEKYIRETLYYLIAKKSYNIINYLIDEKYVTVDDVLIEAVTWNNLVLIKEMIKKGATKFNEAAEAAANAGYGNMAKFLVEQGANNYDVLKNIARENGDIDLYNYLK